MNIKCCTASFIAVSAFSNINMAQAGPPVQIVFNNKGNMDAVYDVARSSAYSYSEAKPKPLPKVNAGAFDTYSVAGSLSPDVTTASFQYRMGSKVCKFKTSYVKLPGRGVPPKWNKSAEASGGARCDVKVTSANVATHAWAVEFTMR
ncbi:hypothetical protein [Pseudomonas huanghezhanensis]|uniref:hypothetical protein n=1 Tax=Pseudomonas huanghezhanensis TaxID=3002903 RepID=UPI0022865A74|nr:hypothetical protein [Pseudomonas sp. BSw22131]